MLKRAVILKIYHMPNGLTLQMVDFFFFVVMLVIVSDLTGLSLGLGLTSVKRLRLIISAPDLPVGHWQCIGLLELFVLNGIFITFFPGVPIIRFFAIRNIFIFTLTVWGSPTDVRF